MPPNTVKPATNSEVPAPALIDLFKFANFRAFMKNAVGPWDGRIKRTRCDSCIRGHLKCEGGTPCKSCIRTQQICASAKTTKSIVFLQATTKNTITSPRGKEKCNFLSRSVTPDDLSLYITHFHESFICSNSFTGGSADQFRDVHLLLRDSSALQNAVVAVSALDVEKRGGRHWKSPENTSLKYYRGGIASVQADLLRSDLRDNTSVLWSTFFLGLFELMFDATGEGWIKHFLHGTSALLQYRGPAAHLSSAGRRFFLTTRVFEISRALIYSSKTFLAQEEWRSLPGKLWSGDQAKDWHPKEALFDLMTACSTLGVRAMKAIRNITDCAGFPNEIVLRELAADGFLLRSELSAWRKSSREWSLCSPSRSPQEQTKIALAYYSAISIFLSGVFDYHSHWRDRGISTPTLSGSEIQAHVSTILEVVGSGLKEGSLAGILFFFPLRVAGARAKTLKQRLEIARLLHLISTRGFVVAQAFVMDLDELWNSKPVD